MWILTLIDIAIKRRRMVISTVVAVCVVAAAVSFLLPRRYSVVTTILPPQEESPIAGLLGSAAATLSQAAASFVLPFMATPSDLYASILESETVLTRAVESLGLIEEYDCESIQQAVAKLRDRIETQVTREGIVKLRVTASTADLAASIANTLVAELNDLNTEIQAQRSQQFGGFLSKRLSDTESELALAQNQLAEFQRDNMVIALDAQSKGLIDILARHQAEMNIAEIEHSLLSQRLDPTHPDVAFLETKIAVLREKLQELEVGVVGQNDSLLSAMRIPLNLIPDLTLRYAVLVRNLKVQEVTYEMLYQQWELARIQAKKDVPVIAVLDRAVPPEEPVWPRKKLIVVTAFLLSLFSSLGVAVLLERLSDPSSTTSRVYTSLREHARTIRKMPLG